MVNNTSPNDDNSNEVGRYLISGEEATPHFAYLNQMFSNR